MLSIILLAVAASGSSPSPLTPSQGVHVGVPPYYLRGLSKGAATVEVRADSAVRGLASYETEGKTIEFSWSYEYGGSASGTAFSKQSEPVTFWPTDVSYFGSNKIAVSGKRRNGNTVIEIWTLETPPYPIALTSIETGQPVIPEVSVGITSKEVVYNDAVPGMDMVRFSWRNHGNPQQLFVVFSDSSNLYSIDTVSLTATLLLSPTSGSQVPTVNELAGDYRGTSSAEHQTHGYMYLLSTDPNEPGSVPLMLRDTNKDGVIDDWIVVDDWAQHGLGDIALYVRTF